MATLTNIRTIGRYRNLQTGKTYNVKIGKKRGYSVDVLFYLQKGSRVYITDKDLYNKDIHVLEADYKADPAKYEKQPPHKLEKKIAKRIKYYQTRRESVEVRLKESKEEQTKICKVNELERTAADRSDLAYLRGEIKRDNALIATYTQVLSDLESLLYFPYEAYELKL